jgi:PAS domain S-box-containing protein
MTDATFLGERRRSLASHAHASLDNERWYRTLGDVAPGFLWLADASGSFLHVNRTWEEFTGSTLDELNKRGWEAYNHPADLDQVRARWMEAQTRSQPFEMELRYLRHDGEYRWMLARVVPLIGTAGQVEGWVGTSVDIHELKQTQEALRLREQDLSDFFENAAVPIHWVGPDGTILRVNQAELDLLGYLREEYVGRNIAEFHADRPVIEDILWRLTSGEVLHDYPAKIRCKDGSLKDVLIDSSVYFRDREFVHTRCFTRDVTAQRKAEQATQQLAAIVASSVDAIVGKTLDGLVTSWNAAAGRIFGYTEEEMVGASIFRLIPEELHDAERSLLARIRTGEAVDFLETERIGKGGRRITIALSVSPIRDGEGRSD